MLNTNYTIDRVKIKHLDPLASIFTDIISAKVTDILANISVLCTTMYIKKFSMDT